MDKGKIRPTRFAHSQGHTDVCYSDDGRYIITCGSDGDVRMFEGLDDDDSKSHNVSKEAYCIACKDKSLMVGTEMNMVQTFTFDEGQPDGIITRFTSWPTHIQISHDRNFIAIASSDMTIKVHDMVNYKDTIFAGHTAPVLSVAIDPKGDFLASSSCDGTVRIWNFRTQSLVRSFSLIPTSNSFSFSKTLCRLCFTQDGRFLLIPANLNILVYNREWKVDFMLQHSSIEEIISIAAISSCGSYVAGGCRDGRIIIWNIETKACILSEKPSHGIAVTGLVWNPSGKEEIVFATREGEIGTVENFFAAKDMNIINQLSVAEQSTRKEQNQIPLENDFIPTLNTEDFDEMADDDSEFSLAKIKAQMGFADDEEGTFIGTMKKNENDDNVSRAPSRLDTPLPELVVPKLPEPQRPFQPGMSPEHLIDRYMVWNNTGIVRQYRSEEENSIEVEFHDSSIHHPLHLNNHIGYSMATLNSQALVLAAESQEDQLSKLCVHHFSSWDGNKEWETEMPQGEDILTIGIGSDCVYAVTDKRNLRVFSIAGVQRDLLSIPGPVVCLAGWESLVMIIYHSGMGVGGEQNMSMIILDVNSKRQPLSSPTQIALSPNSFLAWAGFTDEGTPMIMDSAGMVKLMHSKMGQMWTCVLDTKLLTKGKSDHYSLIGANEIQGVIRCILCKGSRYPPVLPRPHVMLLELKMPLCEMDSEKGTLEENLLRSKLLSGTVENLTRRGVDVEATQNDIERKLKENMLKLFALACRSDRELRALQICESIPSHEMIDIAIKYATKIHRMQLAERLSEVVQRKMEENLSEQQEENHFSHRSYVSSINEVPAYDDSPSQLEETALPEHQSEISENEIKNNPLLAASSRRISKDSSYHKTSISPALRNPFKKSQTPSSSSKGLELLDSFKNSLKETPVLKPIVKKPKSKLAISRNQSIADKFKTQPLGKENNAIDGNQSLPVTESGDITKILPAPKKPSALKLWLEDNKSIVIEKYPEASETELLVKAALLFKDVDNTVKERYKVMAAGYKVVTEESIAPKNSLCEDGDKKRRPDAGGVEEPVEKKQRSSISKLSAFAFSKNSS